MERDQGFARGLLPEQFGDGELDCFVDSRQDGVVRSKQKPSLLVHGGRSRVKPEVACCARQLKASCRVPPAALQERFADSTKKRWGMENGRPRAWTDRHNHEAVGLLAATQVQEES